MIPYGHQQISESDIQAVIEVLQSDFLTQGPVVPLFEGEIRSYTGSKYAVAVNSGTSALHIACQALGLGKGDWLWTSPITFVASANCGLYCGAQIDFVDIDKLTWNLNVSALEEKLVLAKRKNRLPKIVVPVHFCGLSCEMKDIYSLSQEYGFHIIEDACHALGGKYKAAPIGSCRFSDITVFSFHPVKTITTGEGGMAVTNSKILAERMTLLRNHGITRDPLQMQDDSDGPWSYQQIALGYNYRLTDLQAALGVSQLQRLDEFVKRRHQIAAQYDDFFRDLPIETQCHPHKQESGMHLYIIRLQTDALSKSHRTIFEELRAAGIGVNLHYIPVHSQPWYRKMGFRIGNFPEAEDFYKQAISIPIFPDLKDEQVRFIAKTIKKVLQ